MTGRNRFSEKALAKVVNAAAESVPGVAKVTASWTDIGTRSYPRCEIRTDQLAGVMQVHSFIAVSWPSPATDIAAKVQANIATWVTMMTGLQCTQVNVTIEQAVESDRRIHLDEVSAAASAPRLRRVQVSTTMPVFAPVTLRSVPVVSPTVHAGHPVISPVTAPPRELHSPALPRIPQPRPVAVPALAPLLPVRIPATAQVRSVAAPPQHSVSPVRPPAPLRVVGTRMPPPRPVRTVRLPMTIPLAAVALPREIPLAPVGVPPTPAVQVTLPTQHPLAPVLVRGVRFVPPSRQAGEPRVH